MESFYDYMMGFIDEDSPRGDLARDMQNDEAVTKIYSREPLREYFLQKSGGWRPVMDTFACCWAGYKGARE